MNFLNEVKDYISAIFSFKKLTDALISEVALVADGLYGKKWANAIAEFSKIKVDDLPSMSVSQSNVGELFRLFDRLDAVDDIAAQIKEMALDQRVTIKVIQDLSQSFVSDIASISAKISTISATLATTKKKLFSEISNLPLYSADNLEEFYDATKKLSLTTELFFASSLKKNDTDTTINKFKDTVLGTQPVVVDWSRYHPAQSVTYCPTIKDGSKSGATTVNLNFPQVKTAVVINIEPLLNPLPKVMMLNGISLEVIKKLRTLYMEKLETASAASSRQSLQKSIVGGVNVVVGNEVKQLCAPETSDINALTWQPFGGCIDRVYAYNQLMSDNILQKIHEDKYFVNCKSIISEYNKMDTKIGLKLQQIYRQILANMSVENFNISESIPPDFLFDIVSTTNDVTHSDEINITVLLQNAVVTSDIWQKIRANWKDIPGVSNQNIMKKTLEIVLTETLTDTLTFKKFAYDKLQALSH